MFYFVYCKKCALKDVKRACYCNCLWVALHLPEMYFWPKMARKKLDFFEMHSCLWTGARVCFRHKWKTGYSFSFTSLFWWVWLIPLKEWVFSSFVSDFWLKFLRIALWRKRLQLSSENHFTENGLILGFLFANGFFGWFEIFMGWNLQELLNCYSIGWHRHFSMFTWRGILVCSIKMLVPLNQRNL